MAAEIITTGFSHSVLPGSYVRPLSDRPCLSVVPPPEHLPLIDLSSTVQIQLIQQISQLCIALRISQDSIGNGDANSLRPNPETGLIDLSSLAQSEKAVQILQELLIQQTMQATADQLIKFSELWITVANALRGSAEWKRRYELERSKNQELLNKAPLNGVCADGSSSKGMDHLAKSPQLHVQENGKSGSSMERICSHEVLQDGGESITPNGSKNKLKRKVKQSLRYVSVGCVKVALLVVSHEFWSSITSDCFGFP